MSILGNIDLASTASVFDAFKTLTVGLNQKGATLEVVGRSGGQELKCANHTFDKDGNVQGASQDSRAVCDLLKGAVSSFLDHAGDRLMMEAYDKDMDDKNKGQLIKNFEDLKANVSLKLSDALSASSGKALLAADVEKIVVSTQTLAKMLKGMNVADFLNKDQSGIMALVNDSFGVDDSVKKDLAKEADAGREKLNTPEAKEVAATKDKITTVFYQNYDSLLSTNPSGVSALKKLQRGRLEDGLKSPAYCAAQARKDFHVVTCPPPQGKLLDKFENASTKLRTECIGGETSAIVDVLAKRGNGTPNGNITFVHVYSDQKLFLGMYMTDQDSQEEANARAINPDPFLAMYHKGMFRLPNAKSKETHLQYVRQDNLLPKLDVVSGTMVDADYEHCGKKRLQKPNKARFFLAAELSFASSNIGNQDRLGHLVYATKFHEEVLGEVAPTEDLRNKRIFNQNRLINRFIDRQSKAHDEGVKINSKPPKNIGGLSLSEYKTAIKIMDFCSENFNGFTEEELTDKQIDAKIDALIEMARDKDSPACKEATENYIKALHHVYAGRFQAMAAEVKAKRLETGNMNLMGDYVGGPCGTGAFDGDAEIIADIEAYEFLMNGGDCLNYVNPVWVKGGDAAVLQPNVTEKSSVATWNNALKRNMEKIRADKDVYIEQMRNRLRYNDVKGADDMSYEQLVAVVKKLDDKLKLKVARVSDRFAAMRQGIGDIDPARIDNDKLLQLIKTHFTGKLFPELDMFDKEERMIKELTAGKSAEELREMLKDPEILNKCGLDARYEPYLKKRLEKIEKHKQEGTSEKYGGEVPALAWMFTKALRDDRLKFVEDFNNKYPALIIRSKKESVEDAPAELHQNLVFSVTDILKELKRLIDDYDNDRIEHYHFGVERPILDMTTIIERFMDDVKANAVSKGPEANGVSESTTVAES